MVAQAVRTATLASAVFSALGMKTTPAVGEERTDIIQALELGTPERLIAFCEGIQMASPIDSFAIPEPFVVNVNAISPITGIVKFVSGSRYVSLHLNVLPIKPA